MNKRRELDDLVREREDWRAQGKKVVWTNGCFDLFHAGHVRALEVAAEQGDVLVVGLNSDRSVRELKDPGRPLLNEKDRLAVLSALEAVDRVLVFDGKRCDRELAALRPDVWTKAGDYTPETLDQAERRAVEDNGGKIVITPLVPGISTTLLVKKIRRLDPEKIVSAASVFIRDDRGRILLVETRYGDGTKWGLPCGGHEHGERLPDTARRETLEETGLEVDLGRYMGVIERIEPSGPFHLALHVFEGRFVDAAAYDREQFTPLDNAVVNAAWFSPERLREQKGVILGRRLWLEYGQNPAEWPPYIFMDAGEE